MRSKLSKTVRHVRAFNWFKRFKDGNFDLGDQSRSGLPLVIDSEVVRQAGEENPITNQRKNSAALNLPKFTLNKVNRRWHDIIHELIIDQK